MVALQFFLARGTQPLDWIMKNLLPANVAGIAGIIQRFTDFSGQFFEKFLHSYLRSLLKRRTQNCVRLCFFLILAFPFPLGFVLGFLDLRQA